MIPLLVVFILSFLLTHMSECFVKHKIVKMMQTLLYTINK